MLLKLYPHAVRVSCGQARVSAAYVRDMLAFPVAGETTMTWCLVWMLSARLRPRLVRQPIRRRPKKSCTVGTVLLCFYLVMIVQSLTS